MPTKVHLAWHAGMASSLREAGLTGPVRTSDDPLHVGPVEPLGAEGSRARREAFWMHLDVVTPDRASAYIGHQRSGHAHDPLADFAPIGDEDFVLWWGPTVAETLFAARVVESFLRTGALGRLLIVDLRRAGPAPLYTWTPASLAQRMGSARPLSVEDAQRWATAWRTFGAGDGEAFAASALPPLDLVAPEATRRGGWSRIDSELLRWVSSGAARDTMRLVVAALHASLTEADQVDDLVLLWRLRVLELAGVVQRSGEGWVVNPLETLPPIPPIGQRWREQPGR